MTYLSGKKSSQGIDISHRQLWNVFTEWPGDPRRQVSSRLCKTAAVVTKARAIFEPLSTSLLSVCYDNFQCCSYVLFINLLCLFHHFNRFPSTIGQGYVWLQISFSLPLLFMVNGLVVAVYLCQDPTDSFNSTKHHPVSNRGYLNWLDLDFYLDTHQNACYSRN